MLVREDFSGAGGASTGVTRALPDHTIVGVESNKAAAATAMAAGHKRIIEDVRAVRSLDWRSLVGYTAGPPCQTFSPAGNGTGRAALAHLIGAVADVAAGALPEEAVSEIDERSVLVLEPMLVIRNHRPTWIILEQVPQVLPVWEVYAEVLRETFGYSVKTGNLHLEQYGVPQSRTRAVLAAHLEQEARFPVPTHSRFHSRSPERLDDGVAPWVSMAEALGIPEEYDLEIGEFRRARATIRHQSQPSPTILGSIDNGNLQWRQRSNYSAGGSKGQTAQERGRSERPLTQPSLTITSKGFAWTHPEGQSRRVSIQEAAVLQSFPADYPWQGRKSDQYLQVGNSMPPVAAEAIARALTTS